MLMKLVHMRGPTPVSGTSLRTRLVRTLLSFTITVFYSYNLETTGPGGPFENLSCVASHVSTKKLLPQLLDKAVARVGFLLAEGQITFDPAPGLSFISWACSGFN